MLFEQVAVADLVDQPAVAGGQVKEDDALSPARRQERVAVRRERDGRYVGGLRGVERQRRAGGHAHLHGPLLSVVLRVGTRHVAPGACVADRGIDRVFFAAVAGTKR